MLRRRWPRALPLRYRRRPVASAPCCSAILVTHPRRARTTPAGSNLHADSTPSSKRPLSSHPLAPWGPRRVVHHLTLQIAAAPPPGEARRSCSGGMPEPGGPLIQERGHTKVSRGATPLGCPREVAGVRTGDGSAPSRAGVPSRPSSDLPCTGQIGRLNAELRVEDVLEPERECDEQRPLREHPRGVLNRRTAGSRLRTANHYRSDSADWTRRHDGTRRTRRAGRVDEERLGTRRLCPSKSREADQR